MFFNTQALAYAINFRIKFGIYKALTVGGRDAVLGGISNLLMKLQDNEVRCANEFVAHAQ